MEKYKKENLKYSRIRYCLRWLLRPLYIATANRSFGLNSEIRFWDKWLRTRGLQWKEDYKRRLNPDLPLSDYHRGFIEHLPYDEIKILDVGAGPLTLLGKKHPTKKLGIVATDVLAKEYDLLLEKYKIQPPVRTIYAEVEKLTEVFPENTFDLVNAENSIDHTQDPIEAIRQMLLVVKEDCFVLMKHTENEAENNYYFGLHQWNFTIQDDSLIIKSREERINVSHEFSHMGKCLCFRENNKVIMAIRKASGAPE